MGSSDILIQGAQGGPRGGSSQDWTLWSDPHLLATPKGVGFDNSWKLLSHHQSPETGPSW